MAQAETTNSTLRLVPKASYSDLEGEFHNAVYMAQIAARLWEDEFSDSEMHLALTGKPNQYFLRSEELETMLFATYQTLDRIRSLRDKYLALLES